MPAPLTHLILDQRLGLKISSVRATVLYFYLWLFSFVHTPSKTLPELRTVDVLKVMVVQNSIKTLRLSQRRTMHCSRSCGPNSHTMRYAKSKPQ